MRKIHKKHELKVPKCKKSSIPEYSTKLHRYHCVKIKPKHHYKVVLIGRTYYSFDSDTGRKKKLATLPKSHDLAHHRKHFRRHIEGRYSREPQQRDIKELLPDLIKIGSAAISHFKKPTLDLNKVEEAPVVPAQQKSAQKVARGFFSLFKKKEPLTYGSSVPKYEPSGKTAETPVGNLEVY